VLTPFDSPTTPDLHWSRGNVGEAMPGVQTPLSWTMWRDGAERALRESAYSVGAIAGPERHVPSAPEARFLRIFHGRVALQAEFLTMLGDRMPGTTGQETAASLFGTVPETIDYGPTRRRYPFVALRFPATFLTTPRRVRRLAAEVDTWYLPALERLEDAGLDAAISGLQDAKARFDRVLTLQSISVVAVIQPLFAALGDLVARAGVGDTATLSGSGGAEMAVVRDIWRAGQGEIELSDVIRAHGFHGPLEGELSSRVWREDARPLERLLATYAKRPSPLASMADEPARAAMRRDVLGALPRARRGPARVVLALAGRRILIRGVLKRSFLQCLDVARASARRAGAELATRGVLDDADDVFYLTLEELTSHAYVVEARELVAERKRDRAEYLSYDLPGFWRGSPQPIPLQQTTTDGAPVVGEGVSPGIAEGLVRVVTDPSTEEVDENEILVATTTDPSWASLMFVSAALVVDIGGPLSHAAVVARELGIPCVVATGNGTATLRTGDRVRVDGSTGEVVVLERTDFKASGGGLTPETAAEPAGG